MEVLLGCGSNRAKKLSVPGRAQWSGLVTLDIEPRHEPDICHDLNFALPFENDSVDELHCYEVLEHLGRQGDYKFFFRQFSDFWRVLRNGGYVLGTVPSPSSPWAWGDPSHTRVIPRESFTFLVQPEYDRQISITPMSDFRSVYQADFDIVHMRDNEAGCLEFGLKAVKPSRCSCM